MLTFTNTRTFTYHGTLEYPTRFRPLTEHLGVTHEAGDGTPTLVQVSSKQRWLIEWERPRPEIVQRWRLYDITKVSRTMIDFWGVEYAVIIPLGKFTYQGEFFPDAALMGSMYPMSVELWRV
jgi:hypothetical protein